jgi:hypothetical protein
VKAVEGVKGASARVDHVEAVKGVNGASVRVRV